jgi:cell division protein FtsB
MEVDVPPRDISGRILGRPLRSPYSSGGTPRGRRWLWILAGAWLLYAAAFSEHSLWRIARLRHELAVTHAELGRVRAEAGRLDARMTDPRERSEHAEQMLRAQGMARPGEIVYRFGADTLHAGAASR